MFWSWQEFFGAISFGATQSEKKMRMESSFTCADFRQGELHNIRL